MTVQFSTELLEKYFAPGIDGVIPENIRDLSLEIPDTSWLQNHFLNSIFGPNFNEAGRARFAILAFRAKTALVAYDRAKSACASFVEKSVSGNPATIQYFEAVAQWEMVILNLHHAADVVKHLADSSVKEDDDVQIIRAISNRIKHVAEDIHGGKHANLTIPMWLTDTGLKTSDVEISFDNISVCLLSLVKIIDELQNPRAMLEKHRP
jgi:hypothetical protein